MLKWRLLSIILDFRFAISQILICKFEFIRFPLFSLVPVFSPNVSKVTMGKCMLCDRESHLRVVCPLCRLTIGRPPPHLSGQPVGVPFDGTLVKPFSDREKWYFLQAMRRIGLREQRAYEEELDKIEGEIQMSRRYYNGAARDLNVKVESFPSNLNPCS